MIRTILTASILLLMSVQVNASIIGNLSYDGTFVTGDSYTYLGLDTMAGSGQADFVTATSAGGAYADFSIADTATADRFLDSLLFGSSACNGAGTLNGTVCGIATGWIDGLFGSNQESNADLPTP